MITRGRHTCWTDALKEAEPRTWEVSTPTHPRELWQIWCPSYSADLQSRMADPDTAGRLAACVRSRGTRRTSFTAALGGG